MSLRKHGRCCCDGRKTSGDGAFCKFSRAVRSLAKIASRLMAKNGPTKPEVEPSYSE